MFSPVLFFFAFFFFLYTPIRLVICTLVYTICLVLNKKLKPKYLLFNVINHPFIYLDTFCWVMIVNNLNLNGITSCGERQLKAPEHVLNKLRIFTKKTTSHWKNTLFLTHQTQLLPPKRLAERLFWEEKVLCWMARGVSGVDVPSLLTDCGSQHEMIWVNRLAAHSQIRHLIKFTPVCLSLAIVGHHVSVERSTAGTKTT